MNRQPARPPAGPRRPQQALFRLAGQRLVAGAAAGILVALVAACNRQPDDEGWAARTPRDVAEELLAIDRAAGARAIGTDPVTALLAVLASDVQVRAPAPDFVRGAAAFAELLRRNPDNALGRLEWAPVRGGVSADGEHGFTYGYSTLHRPDGSVVPGKYVAYWHRLPEGWRVIVYRRIPRPAGDVSLDLRPPALPVRLVAPSRDSARTARYAEELGDTERAFSSDAQSGIGAAFARFAAPDAMNVGGPSDTAFVYGPEEIGRSVQAGVTPGTVITWAPHDVIVASSGDLGVTLGVISIRLAGSSAEQRVSFFTVWRREGPDRPWRFVAE
jgi:ketosteroid isomerase-like protein